MAGNSFGTLFRITTFGESHGPYIGVVIDGCYPGVKLNTEAITLELSKEDPDNQSLQQREKKMIYLKLFRDYMMEKLQEHHLLF